MAVVEVRERRGWCEGLRTLLGLVLSFVACGGGSGGSSASGSDGTAAAALEIPRFVEGQECYISGLNNDAHVLLYCSDVDQSHGRFRVWSANDGLVRLIPVPLTDEGWTFYLAAFGEGDVFTYVLNGPGEPVPNSFGSVSTKRRVFYFDGEETQPLPAKFSWLHGMSPNGRYILVNRELPAPSVDAGGELTDTQSVLLDSLQEVMLPAGDQELSFTPAAVNDQGVVAGGCTVYSTGHAFFAAYACRWQAGSLELLPPPGRPERSNTFSEFINGVGAIAAAYQSDVLDPAGNLYGATKSVLYLPDGTVFRPNRPDPGELFRVDSINNRNTALAYAFRPGPHGGGPVEYFLVVPQIGTVPLLGLLPPEVVAFDKPGFVLSASYINDHDQVLVTVYGDHGEPTRQFLVSLQWSTAM